MENRHMILLSTMEIISRGISKKLVTLVTSREKLIPVSGERSGRETLHHHVFVSSGF